MEQERSTGERDDPALQAGAAARDVRSRPVEEEFDTPTEVDAAFRTQRRAAAGYGVVFALALLSVPALTVALPWWSRARLIGGMSPAFVMAAGGLYLLFFGIALAAALLANAVEDAMLGGRSGADDPPEPGPGAGVG